MHASPPPNLSLSKLQAPPIDDQNEFEDSSMPSSERVIMHNGKRYRTIQLDGIDVEENEFLIDDDDNIYSLDFKYIKTIMKSYFK